VVAVESCQLDGEKRIAPGSAPGVFFPRCPDQAERVYDVLILGKVVEGYVGAEVPTLFV
jgi:hypothetical protein